MKEIKSLKKTSVLKKIFIKICRLLDYELVDQSTLEFPVSRKNYSNNHSVPGKKSLSLGSGNITITRKVEGIDIIIKTCTSVQLVSQNKKRIFEKEKSEYTFRAIKSICRSAEELKKKFPNIFIQFSVIDIGSPQSDVNKILSFFPKNFETKLISLNPNKLNFLPKTINKNNKEIENNMSTTMATIHESFNLAKNCKDLVYFVEDDYIHKTEALTEMIFSYEKFSFHLPSS